MSLDLSQGQAIDLEKRGGGGLTRIRMGLGWAAAREEDGLFTRLFRRRATIDLDASAVLFAGDSPEDVVYFRKLSSDDGSVRHSGDSLTGGVGDEDDEAIVVDLARVPEHIDQIVFTVSSFTGQRFSEVGEAFCRLVDETTGDELARYTLSGGGEHTGQVMAKVRRKGDGWRMTAIGAPAEGATFQSLMPDIQAHL
ncbi:TerD family protein [Streptomyces sp. RFCAC02]|uniref:TerD family protein n=1 Tax=Streptomyces sp. RFCAC02 TaxID=2499143 RepID=UPI0010214DF2|nr:TerD family protein [Streptomyces sp. RFCAC02]